MPGFSGLTSIPLEIRMDDLPPYGVSKDKTPNGYEIITKENGRVTCMRLFSDDQKADEFYKDERRRLGLVVTIPDTAPSSIYRISGS
jgi:hypothetical protein